MGTDRHYDAAIAYATERGKQDGAAAATWVDFDSEAHAAEWLRADAAGDYLRDSHGPGGMPWSGPFGWDKSDPGDYIPSAPLSGEYAGGLTPTELAEAAAWSALWDGTTEPDADDIAFLAGEAADDIATAYEDAYSEAAAEGVAASARTAAGMNDGAHGVFVLGSGSIIG